MEREEHPRPNRASVLPSSLGIVCLAVVLLAPTNAHATPFFARRYETTCTTCHQGTYPRLNRLGRRFKENGYQFPPGVEAAIRARRNVEPGDGSETLALFKEVPLAVRLQTFGVISPAPDARGAAPWDTALFSYLMGGGAIAPNVSVYFTMTPFPSTMLHKAALGVHNIGASSLGEGSLNVMAGALILEDFARPSHRNIPLGPDPVESASVGENRFSLDSLQLGARAYGRPNYGPFFYEVAVVSGDPGDGFERDRWKDVYLRTTYTLFANTDHEWTPGVFAYVGRSDIQSQRGGVTLLHRDDFYLVGGELEGQVGPVFLYLQGYYRFDGDPHAEGGTASLIGLRGEATYTPATHWVTSLRYSQVLASDATGSAAWVIPHVAYLPAANVQLALSYRYDILDWQQGSALLTLEGVF